MATSDWILLAGVVLGILYGWRTGTINVVAKIGSYVLGYRLARAFSSVLAGWIAQSMPQPAVGASGAKWQAFFSLFFGDAAGGFLTRLLQAASFVIIFVAVTWLVRKIAFSLTGAFGKGLLGKLNRVLGAFLGLLVALGLISIFTEVLLPACARMGMGSGLRDFFDSSLLVMPLLKNIQDIF